MSEGSVFKRKDGKYCAKYKGADGTWKYIYRKTKTEARQALRAALKDRDEGRTPLSPRNGVTVGEAVRIYMDEMDVSARTLQDRGYLVKNHLCPIADKKVSAVTPDTIRALYRNSPLAPSSIKLLHTILRNALPKQCMEGVKPPRSRSKEMDILSKQQLSHLLDTVRGDKYEAVFLLMALCALRIGEALAVRFEDVDFEKGTLQIRRTLWQGQVSEPKTPASRRTLVIPQRTLRALVRLRDNTVGGTGYIAATGSGKPCNYSNFYTRHWKPAIRAAGLPDTLTPHALRHGAASLLLNEGVAITVTSRYLGHANPAITMKVYAHVLDGTSHVAASAMDEALG
jgi:integrase